MALMIDISKDPFPKPKDYGLVDFYHNKDGQVDYTYFYDSRYHKPDKNIEFEPRSKQRYTDECTEQVLDNLSWAREKYANRCTEFKKYERWLEEWN